MSRSAGMEPVDRLLVAQVRILPGKGDLIGNAALLSTALENCPAEVDVVVTPECFLDGYIASEAEISADDLHDYAVELDAPIVHELAAWCRERRSWLVCGCSRRVDQGVMNSALIFDRDGVIHGIYDKTHCQTHDVKFIRGDRLPVFAADFGIFGVMICADRRWPETVRSLATQGSRIIFNPTYGMHDDRNLAMMRTRSFESEVFIVFTHPQQSLITDPRGAVVTDDRSDAALTLTRIDLREVDTARTRASSHLTDRRLDLYG